MKFPFVTLCSLFSPRILILSLKASTASWCVKSQIIIWTISSVLCEYQIHRDHTWHPKHLLGPFKQPSKTNFTPLAALADASRCIIGAVIDYNQFPQAPQLLLMVCLLCPAMAVKQKSSGWEIYKQEWISNKIWQHKGGFSLSPVAERNLIRRRWVLGSRDCCWEAAQWGTWSMLLALWFMQVDSLLSSLFHCFDTKHFVVKGHSWAACMSWVSLDNDTWITMMGKKQ